MEKMSFDEIKDLLINNKIGAITIDTSIFERLGKHLESGKLDQVKQFKETPTRILLSEIVKNELLKHMQKDTKDAYNKINSALKKAEEIWQVPATEILDIKSSIYSDRTFEQLATSRFNNFVDRTGLEIIGVDGNISIKELIDRYFTSKPPFAKSGDKKCEFPDAIALMSLEDWAQKNNTIIIVVAVDGDWEKFCSESDSLIYIDDLGEALSIFQLQTKAYEICKKLSNDYEDEKIDDIKGSILDALSEELWSLTILCNAESAFEYEGDVDEIVCNDFEFEIIDEPNIIFTPINYGEEYIVVEAKLSVNVDISCDFSFYVKDSIDKDYIPMGSSSETTNETFELDTIITFCGSLEDLSKQFTVEDVNIEIELGHHYETANFGYIDPFSSDNFDRLIKDGEY